MNKRSAVKAAIGGGALLVIVWVFLSTLQSAPDFVWPSVPVGIAACVAIGLGLGGGALSWAALLEGSVPTRRAVSAFLLAQPAKYLPVGGIAQAAGQVGMSGSPGDSTRRVAGLFLVHAGVQVAAGLTVGGLSLFTPARAQGELRLAFAGMLLAPLLLNRRLMVAVLTVGARILRRAPADAFVPSQKALLASGAWAVVPIAASGFALSILIPSDVNPLATIAAFGVAWSIGFLAVPFPSGLGVREAVLVTLLGLNPALLIAGSAAHRLATIAAEGGGVLVAGRLRR